MAPGKKRASSPTGRQPEPKLNQPRGNTDAQASDDSDAERGQFEDKWEDEYESEDVISEIGSQDGAEEEDEAVGHARNKVGGMDLDQQQEQEGEGEEPMPYLPQLGQGEKQLKEGEELVPDWSSYVMLHHARLAWPCLSFDVLKDNAGKERMKPPFSACVVAGTQAADTEADANELVVMKWDNLSRAKPDESDSEEEEDDEDEENQHDTSEDALLLFRSIPHKGGVNRVRAQCLPADAAGPPAPPQSYHAATFADTGKVHLFDIAPHLHSLLYPESGIASNLSKKPVATIDAHGRAEGYALDWSPIQTNRLLSGDIHSKIFLSTLDPSGGVNTSSAYQSHTSSVEDLQWSPSEATVFASCSADQSVRIWDTRVKNRKSVLNVEGAHDSDVNVISWNKLASYLLLSGGDEGGLKVWDMRNMKTGKSKPSPVAAFDWHKAPIWSVEWHPTEESAFAAACADDSVTLWDLSVELDEEEAPSANAAHDKSNQVPPQLLFVHQGQQEIKEVHWHPQIPGSVISTAATGLDVFKTVSI